MTQPVTACLIIIGNEILSGRTKDQNLAHIAEKLNDAGVRLMEVRVVPDIEQTIVGALNEVRKKFNYVFTTGGIGPTHDDITSLSVARAFGVGLFRHPAAEAALRHHYEGSDALNEARLKMADVPVGAELIPNPVSTAPGFRIDNVFVMAGVPRIMQAMLDAILPLLKGGEPVHSLSVTTNLTEGTIAAGLTAIQQRYPDIEIGSYPHYSQNQHSTSLVLRSPDVTQNEQAAGEVRELIASLGGIILNAPTI